MSTFLVRGCSLSKCWKDLCPLARILPSPSLCTSLKHLGVLRKVTVQAGVTVISHMFMHLLGLILNAGRKSLLCWLCCAVCALPQSKAESCCWYCERNFKRKAEKVPQLTTFIKSSAWRCFMCCLPSEPRVKGAANPAEKAAPWEQSSTRRNHISGLCERAEARVFAVGRESWGIPQGDPGGESLGGCPRCSPRG